MTADEIREKLKRSDIQLVAVEIAAQLAEIDQTLNDGISDLNEKLMDLIEVMSKEEEANAAINQGH